MGTTEGFVCVSMELPINLGWKSEKFRQFFLELVEYMGKTNDQDMGDYLIDHPNLEYDYEAIEKILPLLKERFERRKKHAH